MPCTPEKRKRGGKGKRSKKKKERFSSPSLSYREGKEEGRGKGLEKKGKKGLRSSLLLAEGGKKKKKIWKKGGEFRDLALPQSYYSTSSPSTRREEGEGKK